MIIRFANKKLDKECNDGRLLVRKHGTQQAKLIMRRLVQLRAAPSLATFHPPYSGPARCHELSGDKKGIFSVDLDHPYRLLFKAAHDPVHKDRNGGIDWKLITAVKIVGIEDTHG